MKTYQKVLIATCAVLLFIVLAVPILKGVVAGLGILALAAALATAFVLGALLVAAITSPLWVPFVMGYLAVYYCKKYIKKTDKPLEANNVQ